MSFVINIIKKIAGVEGTEQAANAARQISQQIRRTAEIGLFFAQASGVVIDQVLQLHIEAGLRVIEATTASIQLQTASTAGFNWATGKVLFQFAAIGLMYAQINALRNQRQEAAQKIGYATSGLRAITF